MIVVVAVLEGIILAMRIRILVGEVFMIVIVDSCYSRSRRSRSCSISCRIVDVDSSSSSSSVV